jgi:hypothetical protein
MSFVIKRLFREAFPISTCEYETDNRSRQPPEALHKRSCVTLEICIDGAWEMGDGHNPIVFVSFSEFIREQNISLLVDLERCHIDMGTLHFTNLL